MFSKKSLQYTATFEWPLMEKPTFTHIVMKQSQLTSRANSCFNCVTHFFLQSRIWILFIPSLPMPFDPVL